MTGELDVFLKQISIPNSMLCCCAGSFRCSRPSSLTLLLFIKKPHRCARNTDAALFKSCQHGYLRAQDTSIHCPFIAATVFLNKCDLPINRATRNSSQLDKMRNWAFHFSPIGPASHHVSRLPKDLSIQTYKPFSFSAQCTEAVYKARCLIIMLRHSIQDVSQ